VIYCGDDPATTSVDGSLAEAKRRFGVVIPDSLDVELVFVTKRHLLEPQR
jgi:hypothetical protein